MRMIGRAGDKIFTPYEQFNPHFLAGIFKDSGTPNLAGPLRFSQPTNGDQFAEVTTTFTPSLASLGITQVRKLVWFNNINKVAILTDSTAAGLGILIYSFDGVNFIGDVDTSAVSGASLTDLEIRPQDDVLIATVTTVGVLRQYNFNGSALTYVGQPAFTGRHPKFSPDGSKLFTSSASSPFYRVTNFISGGFTTALTTGGTVPPNDIVGGEWLNNSTVIMTFLRPTNPTTFTALYTISGSTITGAGNLEGSGGFNPISLVVSKDKTLMAIRLRNPNNTQNFTRIVKIHPTTFAWTSLTFSGAPDPASSINFANYTFSSDNKFLATAFYLAPHFNLRIWELNNATNVYSPVSSMVYSPSLAANNKVLIPFFRQTT